MVVVTLALSASQMKRERTFSCSEWPQSARSLHVAWPASPATTRRQKHLWHGGYPRKRSSGLGWAGSCPSFDRSQTKLYKNNNKKDCGYTPSFLLSWIWVLRFHAHPDCITVSLAENGSYEFLVLHYWSLLLFLLLHTSYMWGCDLTVSVKPGKSNLWYIQACHLLFQYNTTMQ